MTINANSRVFPLSLGERGGVGGSVFFDIRRFIKRQSRSDNLYPVFASASPGIRIKGLFIATFDTNLNAEQFCLYDTDN